VDLERKRSDLIEAQNDLLVAQADLAKEKAGQNIKLLKAQRDLASARASLKLGQATIDVDSLRSNLKLVESRVENTIIRAQTNGLILKVYRRPGEAITSDPILKMADVTSMITLTEVYETDVHLVHLWQTATVTASALDEPLTGKVTFVGRLVSKQDISSNDPSVATDARVVEVVVQLDKPELANRLINLQTQVTIRIKDATLPTASK